MVLVTCPPSRPVLVARLSARMRGEVPAAWSIDAFTERPMPMIKPRTRGKKFVRQRIRLEQENYETLHAYAAFLGESAEYVLNQVFETVLMKDREFAQWRAEHPESHVPRLIGRGGPRAGRRTRTSPAGTDAGPVSATPSPTRVS
jgi:hypothetical protein